MDDCSDEQKLQNISYIIGCEDSSMYVFSQNDKEPIRLTEVMILYIYIYIIY